ncbi:GtrA family protein [Egicoccus halophilus]|uniref:GtrA/DPMS transmembrane domain-containing protein n=1 Tax=Egicoccus halophilus TaxID=1670830 RepID=A0A8J3AE67_9ACTN|nr:GtrA family protein [Egicoccus halophilus]GGI05931.1 hypothetical protein GCM10011354_16570 [Egicoccus halophilus]
MGTSTEARASGARGLRDARRLLRYGVSGTTAALVHLLALTALVELLAVRPVTASAMGFGCGLVVSYALQRRWVFATRRRHRRTLPRYLVVVGAGLAVNTLVLLVGTELFSHHYAWVQLAAFVAAPANNYVLNSLWTFR